MTTNYCLEEKRKRIQKIYNSFLDITAQRQEQKICYLAHKRYLPKLEDE